MDDGGYTGNGLKLYTNAFRIEDLDLLIEALNKNFGLIATVNKTYINNQNTLYLFLAFKHPCIPDQRGLSNPVPVL